MLEKERFLAIKKLARDIREDNKKLFKSFKKLPFDEAVEKKNDFINSIIENMDIAFSDGEQGREEKQMFRANILIPDDKDFFENYTEDKNIRNLMNKYNVSIEDIMSKITELNIYGKYIDDSKIETEEAPTFVDEMIKISPKEAESLLDEIDNLSSVMEDLDLENIPKEVKPELLRPEESEEDVNQDDSFENITSAVSNFVNRYENMQSEMDAKDEKIRKLQLEIEKLDKISSEASEERENLNQNLLELKEENAKCQEENEKLRKENEKLEAKLAKSAEILNKIYRSILKNRD